MKSAFRLAAAAWPLLALACSRPAPAVPQAPVSDPAPRPPPTVVEEPPVPAANRPPGPEPRPLDGALLEDAPPRCPPEMVLVVDDVCIDRWEASLVEAGGAASDGSAPDGAEEKTWSPYQSVDDARVHLRAVSRRGAVPQGYISGQQAEQACQASGKRLCTASEWEAACRGPEDTTYPYGATRHEGTCNDDGRPLHPVAEVTKRLGLPPDRMWYEGMDHPLINQLKQTLRKTGERESCTNETGAFDMVGNLHEWIEDPEGTFRGGFYMDTQINGEGCDYATTAHSKKYHDYSTGFRCCMDADSVE